MSRIYRNASGNRAWVVVEVEKGAGKECSKEGLQAPVVGVPPRGWKVHMV